MRDDEIVDTYLRAGKDAAATSEITGMDIKYVEQVLRGNAGRSRVNNPNHSERNHLAKKRIQRAIGWYYDGHRRYDLIAFMSGYRDESSCRLALINALKGRTFAGTYYDPDFLSLKAPDKEQEIVNV